MNIRVGTIVRPGQMAAPLKPIPWTKWSKMKWKPANRTQMKVWDDFNKSRLQIGVLVSNFEGFPGINMSKPCLSSSATSLGKPLISKPSCLSSVFCSYFRTSLTSYLLPFLHLLPLSFKYPMAPAQLFQCSGILLLRDAICDISIHRSHIVGEMCVNRGRQFVLPLQYTQPASNIL